MNKHVTFTINQSFDKLTNDSFLVALYLEVQQLLSKRGVLFLPWQLDHLQRLDLRGRDLRNLLQFGDLVSMGDGRLLQLHYLLPVRLRDFFGYWVCVIQWRNISISRTIKSLMLFLLNYARILAVYHDFDKREGIRIWLLTWPNVKNHAEITWQKDWLVKVLCKLIHPMCTCWCDFSVFSYYCAE